MQLVCPTWGSAYKQFSQVIFFAANATGWEGVNGVVRTPGMVEVIPERCVPIAKRELLYLGTVGWACWLSGIIFIDRYRRDAAIEVIARTASAMRQENVRETGWGNGGSGCGHH